MKSITYGEVTLEQMTKLIKDYIFSEANQIYRIIVGTDSQNFDSTKTVMVVAVCRVGKGGIFFYDVNKVKKITNIKQKLFYETSISLNLANKLSVLFENQNLEYKIGIHVDAGWNGKTSTIIPEITSWVQSCGFDCQTKPYSYAASSIANKYSK